MSSCVGGVGDEHLMFPMGNPPVRIDLGNMNVLGVEQNPEVKIS